MSKPIDPHWARWIHASAAKHFKAAAVAATPELHMHVEGFKRQTEELEEWIEFRLDGPYYKEYNRGHYQANVEINVAVMVTEQGDDAYRIHDINGIVAAAFTFGIPVFKLGPSSDPENDGSYWGCLTLLPGERERIQTSIFGKIRPDTDLLQSTVEGHYRLFIDF